MFYDYINVNFNVKLCKNFNFNNHYFILFIKSLFLWEKKSTQNNRLLKIQ